MISTVASTASGSRIKIIGSTNMPTETKNSTAKASRNGIVSEAARWLNSDSLKIMPAKNAPSANETSNSIAAPKATPSAMASTDRRNSLTRPGMSDIMQDPRDQTPAHDQHDGDEGRGLAQRDRDRERERR